MNTLSMGGPYIGAKDIPVDAVRQLNNGTPIFLSQGGQHVKMTMGPPWSDTTDGRYYVGTIAEFSQAKWDSASKINPPTGYSVRPQTLKKANGRPANAYTNSMIGKCSNDAGTPAKGTTLLEVQNECALQDTCTGYSYNTKTGNYTLHTTDLTTGDGQTDWRCVPKAMIGVCRTEDQKEVPWSTFPGSYAECATKCMDDPKCQAYGFKGLNNTCLIHGVGPNPGNAAPGARVTSTNINVPVWSCVVKTGRKGTASAASSTPVATPSTPVSTPSTPAAAPLTAPAPTSVLTYPACAPGYVGPDSTGMCKGGYKPGCDIACEQRACAASSGKWIPADYQKSPYLCQMTGFMKPVPPPAPAPTPAPAPVTPVAPAVQVQMATPPPAPAPVTPAAPAPSVQDQTAPPAPSAGPAPVPASTPSPSAAAAVSTSTPSPSPSAAAAVPTSTPSPSPSAAAAVPTSTPSPSAAVSTSTPSPSPSMVPTPVMPAPTPAVPSALQGSAQVPAPAPSGPELNDNWMCISDFSAPVKRFGNDVGCLTLDGKTCLYDYCSKPDSKFPANPQSLICGNDYKSKLGVTGYESPDGWCSKVNRVLPGGTPTPLPVSAPAVEPVAPTPQTSTPAAQAVLPPVPAPSVAFTDLGMGLCRTSGMEYPAYEQRQIGEPECLNACQQDLDCMGYAMSSDGYCQLYNVKSATVPRSAKVGDMLEKVDGNPSWKCKVKTPKVAIAGPLLDTLSSAPLTPTEANQQFDDVLLSQAANAPSAATDLPSVVGTRTGTGLSDLITPSASSASSSALSPIQSLFQLPSMFSSSSGPSSTLTSARPSTLTLTSTSTSTPSVPSAPTRTPTQVLGAVTAALYAPQIQAYNACSAYFKKQSGGAKTKAKAKTSSKPYASAADSSILSKAAIDHQRNVLRASLAARR